MENTHVVVIQKYIRRFLARVAVKKERVVQDIANLAVANQLIEHIAMLTYQNMKMLETLAKQKEDIRIIQKSIAYMKSGQENIHMQYPLPPIGTPEE